MMNTFILLFLEIQSAAAVTHSLQYFYTGSAGVNNFPEFVAVGFVNGEKFIHYDSVTKRATPKQEWMEKSEGPKYWEKQTQISSGTEQVFKVNIENIKKRFNQTGGVHVFQTMYGCEWDDETGEVKGYEKHGYDGEDFLALDLKSKSWITPKPQAVISKNKLDNEKFWMEQEQNYYTQICPEWLRKHLNNGRTSLMRTDRPSVSLLQKTSSSPVTCHASGFYPPKAEMFWRKDGEEVHEGVEKGEILPNNDGTFQMSVELVAPEDWSRYECVFQLSGVKEDIKTRLEKPGIRTNEVNSNFMIIPILVAVVVLVVLAVIGFILYKKKNAKRPPSPVETAEVKQEMLPKA